MNVRENIGSLRQIVLSVKQGEKQAHDHRAFRSKALLSFYLNVARFIIDALIVAILFTLFAGTLRVFKSIFDAIANGAIEQSFHVILGNVMVVFVFVELFRVLIEYFKEERVKLTYIADATIVLILKEIWVRFTAKAIVPGEAIALVVVLFAVGCIRLMAVWRSPSAEAAIEEQQ